jgi:PAS domain S-box-containing protein
MLHAVSRSVRHKLVLVVLAGVVAALIVAGVALVTYDLRGYRESSVADVTTQADILGRASAPALAFDDPKAARENLLNLKAKPTIAAAAIYSARGKLFAAYTRDDGARESFPGIPESDGSRVDGSELVLYKRIVENNEILGTVYIKADYEWRKRLVDYAGIFAAVMALSMVAALAVSAWLQTVLTKPILATATVARQVVQRRDFSLRAEKTTEDEIGQLVDAFNDMLSEIGRSAAALQDSNRSLAREMGERQLVDEELRRLNTQLERRVADRTAQLEASNREIDESREQFRAVTETANDAVVSADARGDIIYFNRAAERILGYAADEVLGRPLAVLMPERFRDEHRAGFERFLATGEPRIIGKTLELAARKKDGTEFPMEISIAHWTTSKGHFFTAMMRDISARREVEEAVQKTNKQLEAANKELEGFSYSVSHDLRAPLRAVVGFSKLLLEDHGPQLNGEARRKLEVIQSEAQRMGVLIDELLTFSRLGRRAMQAAELDMTQLARATFESLNGHAEGPRVQFSLAALPRATGDRVLLGQVWANLLANAIKFSSKRERPVIEVSAITDEREHIYFVRDNGAGFDPRYRSKLFGVFQRLHNSSEFPGTGVGLALVERIVTRHGGRVWADSRPDEGATFYFTLPKGESHGNV